MDLSAWLATSQALSGALWTIAASMALSTLISLARIVHAAIQDVRARRARRRLTADLNVTIPWDTGDKTDTWWPPAPAVNGGHR